MDNARITPVENGSQQGRSRLLGCPAVVGICIILSAVGAWAIYQAAERGAALPAGITYHEVWLTGEQFIDGLMEGSIRPETGVRILSQLFINASDGILTKEEIGSILEQMKRGNGMNL